MLGGGDGGYVLAGGRSSRMGTDKALLRFRGITLLERAVTAVEQAAGRAVVIGDANRYGTFGYPVIPDRHQNAGPLGGIEAALRHTEHDWNLVVACDMPGLDAQPLAELLRAAVRMENGDVLLPETGNQPQPLCAVYHRRALPAIDRALHNGQRKVMDALAPLRVVRFPMSDDGLFRNVNTPAEWDAALRP